jgi:hypothetical protein
MVSDPTSPPLFVLILSVIIFGIGWTLSRGANNQKYYFKTEYPKSKTCFGGFITQNTTNFSTNDGELVRK